ncbi:hypothetical protein LBMAG47_28250 [Planctomycetia bacterium]|nr:hypothetical protein LBMAG47_28250 [Planctomycetia bacterium]
MVIKFAVALRCVSVTLSDVAEEIVNTIGLAIVDVQYDVLVKVLPDVLCRRIESPFRPKGGGKFPIGFRCVLAQ